MLNIFDSMKFFRRDWIVGSSMFASYKRTCIDITTWECTRLQALQTPKSLLVKGQWLVPAICIAQVGLGSL